MIQFSGLFTPVVTPFVSGSPDEAGLLGNIRHWMGTRLRGIVVLGSAGEAAHLEDHEADRLLEVARSAVPRDRVLMAGTGRDGTKATIEATRRAAKFGVDAVLVRTPGFFKGQMTPDAFVRHYHEVADASPVPVLLYNVQAYTGVSLTPATVERLAVHPNIVGIKESGGDIGQIAEVVNRTPDDFVVLAGSATTFLPALCVGAAGGILAVAGLVPELCHRLMALVSEGRLAEARALQRRLNPLARSVGTTYGVPGLKAALDLMGLAGGAPRQPLAPAPPSVVEQIQQQLAALGLPVRG
ncbi:MAG: dihydrodipicolinate synthase family protein [Vicinamibacterales bacterium]|nr:dihydrodipicolinate synthase family protein [Vicinamibacterales bacterium]